MSQDIINEVYFFAGSVCMGIIITFVYDFLLILRRVAAHNIFWISLEDFFFWAVCAVSVFYMLYEENNGILRWFAVLGAAFGMFVYKKTISRYFVHIMSVVIEKEICVIRKVFGILLKPFRYGIKKAKTGADCWSRKQRKIHKYIKKKLTGFQKVLKITVSKH